MSLLVPNEGKVGILDLLNGGDFPGSVRLGLFKNNLTADKNTVLGDVTPANFSGYADDVPAFGAASVVSDKGEIVQATPTDFVHDGGGTANDVYGYYVWDDTASVLLWIERFSALITMVNLGDTITVTSQLTCDTE